MTDTDVTIVGGGVAGLTAGAFAVRAGLGTVVIDGDESILRRNAILENVPGFPAGVDPRLFLETTHEQAERAGCEIRDGRVTAVAPVDDAGSDDSDGPSARFAVAVDENSVKAPAGSGRE